jgi:hypothetical protein
MTAAEVDGGKASHEDAHDVKLTPLLLAKYILSVGMLIFSIILVGALMFTGNTRVSRETNPWVCLVVCVSIVSRLFEDNILQDYYFCFVQYIMFLAPMLRKPYAEILMPIRLTLN